MIQELHLLGPSEGSSFPPPSFLTKSLLLTFRERDFQGAELVLGSGLGDGGSDPAHSLEGQQPSLPDGRLSKAEESGLSGQAARRASVLLRSGIRFLEDGLRKAVGCWSLGSVPALSMPGRAWRSLLFAHPCWTV